MRNRGKVRKSLALILTFALIASMAINENSFSVFAASKYVKSIKMSTGTMSVNKGAKATRKVTVAVKGKVSKNVSVKSSKKSVASVKVGKPNKKGVSKITVTGKSAGTAKITVTTKAKNKKGKKLTKKFTVKVEEKVSKPNVTEAPKNTPNSTLVPVATQTPGNTDNTPSVPGTIEVNSVSAVASPSGQITVGGSCTIVAAVLPSNATNQTLTYASADPTIAAVNAAGVVTGLKAGATTIRVSAANGKYAEVIITVVAVGVESVTLDRSEIDLTVTATTTLVATVLPENATNKGVSWTSEDPSIAKVDQNGKVTGVAPGTTNIKVTTVEGGLSALCRVTIKSNSVVADGVTAEVTNPYVDNADNEYENTVLVGDDLNLRVFVGKNGQPVGKTNINVTMKAVYGNASNMFEIRDDYLETDENGYANFAIGLKRDYADVNAVQGYFQSYKVVAKEVSSNMKAEISIRFASVDLSDVIVQNNEIEDYNEIVPSTNAGVEDDGIYSTKAINGCKNEEYVTSQQVSSSSDDHKVYLSATPKLLLPATVENQKLDNWTITFPTENGERGVSGSYSVYNDASNKTTTTEVLNVPAGLQYMTLHLDKLKLSDYTSMYIDMYNDEGKVVYHKEVKSTQNNSQTIQVSHSTTTESKLVISIVSQGQVDASNEGYVLKKIVGEWEATQVQLPIEQDLMNTVTWTDVSEQGKVSYETQEMSYAKAAKYIPSDSTYLNQESYSYSYKVPAFPYTGNAIISVTNKTTNKVVAYFLYPTENAKYEDGDGYQNVNVLAPVKTKAVQAAEEEVAKFDRANVSTNEYQEAVVDASLTGITHLRADIRVSGLDNKELNEQNGGKLYTSIQWAPLPKTVEEEKIPEFYAMEGQIVTVIAQLVDKDGKNNVSQAGEEIKIIDGNKREIKRINQEIGGDDKNKNTAQVVTAVNTTTDSKGQVKIQFKGTEIDYIEGLTATSENYNVKLIIDDQLVEKANIYWVDMGITFVNSAVADDSPVRTTNFENKEIDVSKESTSKVGRKWYIGVLPVARAKTFDYSEPTEVDRSGYEFAEFVGVDNVEILYSKTDTMNDRSTLSQINSIATVGSERIGKTFLSANFNINSSNAGDIIFRFMDEDGNLVQKKNVGEKESSSITNTGLKITINWTENGLQLQTITPDQRNLNINTSTTVYAQVLDEYGNKLGGKTVKVVSSGLKDHDYGDYTTDENGIVAVSVAAPEEVGNLLLTFTLGNEDAREYVSLEYTETEEPAFAISKDDTTTKVYAVSVLDSTHVQVRFTNKINPATLKAKQFTFTQNGATDITYEVTDVIASMDNNKAVVLTLDKAIANGTAMHTITINPYTDEDGVVYTFMDMNGQKIASGASTVFTPSERKKD